MSEYEGKKIELSKWVYSFIRDLRVWGLSLHSQKARSDHFANFLPIFPMWGHGVVVNAFACESEGPVFKPGRQLVLLLFIVQFLLRVLKAF